MRSSSRPPPRALERGVAQHGRVDLEDVGRRRHRDEAEEARQRAAAGAADDPDRLAGGEDRERSTQRAARCPVEE